MRTIVALVFGGWFRNVLSWSVDDGWRDRAQAGQPAVTGRETDEPMWVSRW